MRDGTRPPLLLLFSLFLVAVPASSRTLRFSRPVAGDRLTPGLVVEVEWPSESVPEEAEEMELVLSLDGGRTFPVRVTGEIAPSSTHIDWRVSSMPAHRARLALRAGEREADADEDSEILCALSGEFEILPDGSLGAEPLLPMAGEWRTRDAVALPDSDRPPSGSLARRTDLGAARRLEPVAPLPRTETTQPARESRSAFRCTRTDPTGSPGPDPPRPAAAPTPLRL